MPRTTIRTEDIADSEVTTAKMQTDPTNASNLSSGSVPTAQLGNVDTTALETDIALLGFKVAANGSLAAYNLKDQKVDSFEDATGVDAGTSTGETRNANNYYSGALAGSPTYTVFNSTPGGGTWTVPTGVTTVEALIVAGGGAGGYMYGGGGGGGGIVHHPNFSVTAGASVTVTVGAGSASQTSTVTPSTGGDSVFSTMTATGGGGGGNNSNDGADGGSGGGGNGYGDPAGSANQPAVSGATVYANAGGSGESAPDYTAGGGGGASAAGSPSNGNVAGDGGDGQRRDAGKRRRPYSLCRSNFPGAAYHSDRDVAVYL